MKIRKKLIEVALPLEAINIASVRESYIYRGNPSALHKWWAQRPLAAARAVIFAQMVDDPSAYVEILLGDPRTRRAAERELKKRQELWRMLKAAFEAATGREEVVVPEPGTRPTLEDCAADIERQRLFRIIEELVTWENTTNETVLEKAKAEIWQSWRRACADNAGHRRAKELFLREELPAFHDPFAGGGTLPLEAQRLGLRTHASDLNPVAVLINKAIIEFPQKFVGRPPVNQAARKQAEHGAVRGWNGAQGLAEDVRHYGQWMRDEAEKRIGQLYPKIEITAAIAAERPDLKTSVGRKLTVIAWLWARTVKSPNPAFSDVQVPLASTFMLSTKVNHEVYVEPVFTGRGYRFSVKVGKPKEAELTKVGTKLSRGANFKCLMSGVPIEPDHIYSEANAGRMGARLMAIVAEAEHGRVYLSPNDEHEAVAREVRPGWCSDVAMPENPRWFSPPLYGLKTYGDLFTSRQLNAMATFSDLINEGREKVAVDAISAGSAEDNNALADGGRGPRAYADCIATYLAFSLSKTLDYNCSLVPWYTKEDRPGHLFSKQAVPMVWDFAELNPLSSIGGSFLSSNRIVSESLSGCAVDARPGRAEQLDAVCQTEVNDVVCSTDPPYYDNIGYADLSDFFYIWLRRALRTTFPHLFSTVVTPKTEELVATPYRHGGREKAEEFFLAGMTQAMDRLARRAHPSFPVTIYYAYKQSEARTDAGVASTGWETFLDAVMRAGFAITGTWPMRTERGSRSVGIGTNALASSIVLVCRPRTADAPTVTRREFINTLKSELPIALANLQRGNIAPVDLAQAAIGPGMAVFTHYAKVIDAGGKQLSVREALAQINQVLDEALAEQEGDFDADSRFAIAWFEQTGFAEGEFGVADVLARAKVTAVSGLVTAGIVASKGGKVRLLRPEELPANWEPATDPRLTVWEMVHQLIRALEASGEGSAASLAAKLGVRAEIARELAYRLYTICERKKRAAEALSYNGLVRSWPEIMRLARENAVGAEPAQSVMSV